MPGLHNWIIHVYPPFQIVGIAVCVVSPLAIVWPSLDPRLSSFKNLIATSVFALVRGVVVHVKVEEGQVNEHFPLQTCSTCMENFSTSGLLGSLSAIKWRINASTDDLRQVVSFM